VRSLIVVLSALGFLPAFAAPAEADDPANPASRAKIVAALERGVPLLEKAARNYPAHRKCFACHHQTLPLLGLGEARRAGVKCDDTLPQAIIDFAGASFRGKLDDLKAGENIGGRGLTVGYGLLALRLADVKPDELTEAMVTFLLKSQEADGRWGLNAIRPPAEDSLVMCTVLAAAGLRHYAAPAQRPSAEAALEKAHNWLRSAKHESQEDKVAMLWGCRLLGIEGDRLDESRQAVLDAQRADGGWGQTAEMESDAYASGSTLFVLLETGLAETHAAAQRAVDFLLKTQLDDGSWHVATRAKPVQVFFDNGDPHGKDQFISIAASGWSVAALARAIRQPAEPAK